MKLSGIFFVLLSILVVVCLSKTNYTATMIVHNSSYYKFNLTYTGSDSYYVKQTSPILKHLVCEFKCLSFNDFNFKIYDLDNPRFQVPQGGLFSEDPLARFSYPISLSDFDVVYNLNPFEFQVKRRRSNATLFSTFQHDLIFSQYYMQITTDIDTQYTYGLGQRFTNGFRLKQGKWTIFNRDRGQVIDKGTGLQTYGHYPVYLQRQRNNLFHVNYLRNSNAMDVIIDHSGSKPKMTFKVIGGIFDFRFLLGTESPEQAVEKFHQFMGRSIIPPFWALGFHQCRWGYQNVSQLQAVLQKYKENKLPLDTIWSDIDYMLDYEDFTIDEKRFPLDRMKAITDAYHYIPIVDAGIKVGGFAYNQGVRRNVFVKDGNGKQLKGKVWPGQTTFVDFFHPQASKYWQDMLQILYNKVQFSGIWLDMNQYANFCDGPCQTPTGGQIFDYSKDLPYNPGSDGIQSHTIPLNSTHYNHTKEADVHAFAAMLQSAATNKFLTAKGVAPFIISRSSTIGSNKYAFHWTGDNYANFEFLKGSISDNFNNQIWGLQMVGPDICGFGGNTTEELCSRWYQLGALYPFARSHNDKQSKDQQPYALGPVVLEAAKTALTIRYALLQYYYHTFVNKRGIGTIFKPLFFEFPFDHNLYVDNIADTQFMIGPQILVAPVVEQGKTSRAVYFPSYCNWYDLYTGFRYRNGTTHIFNNSLTDGVPLFLRQGGIILTSGSQTIRSTKDLTNIFHLVGGFRFEQRKSNATYKHYEAAGGILSIQNYNDVGLVSDCLKSGCEYAMNCIVQDSSQGKQLQIDVNYFGSNGHNQIIKINRVTVFYEGHRISNYLEQPLIINRTMKVAVPLTENEQEKVSFKNLRKRED